VPILFVKVDIILLQMVAEPYRKAHPSQSMDQECGVIGLNGCFMLWNGNLNISIVLKHSKTEFGL